MQVLQATLLTWKQQETPYTNWAKVFIFQELCMNSQSGPVCQPSSPLSGPSSSGPWQPHECQSGTSHICIRESHLMWPAGSWASAALWVVNTSRGKVPGLRTWWHWDFFDFVFGRCSGWLFCCCCCCCCCYCRWFCYSCICHGTDLRLVKQAVH